MVRIFLNNLIKEKLNLDDNYLDIEKMKTLNEEQNKILESYINIDNLVFDIDYNNILMDNNRPKEIKQRIKNYQNGFEYRSYNKFIKTNKNQKVNHDVKEFTQTMSFAFSFIFILFTSSLFGYYFGTKILNASFEVSLILSIFCGFFTLILELTIFQIREYKKHKSNKN